MNLNIKTKYSPEPEELLAPENKNNTFKKGIRIMKKNMKKVMALALAASMTLGMTTVGLAAINEADAIGSITIENATANKAYNAYKIFDWYAIQKKDNDLIISASLDFLLKPIMDMLNIKNWISTKYDVKTGKINGENCYGEEKLKQFRLQFSGHQLEAFYSDSMSDFPMFKESNEAYLVNKKPQKISI